MDQNGGSKPLYPQSSQEATEGEKDEHFYEATEINSPEFENSMNTTPMSAEEKAKQEEQWKEELEKLEDEILTLRQVLSSKVKQAGKLKRDLGITPMQEFKSDFQSGLKTVKESETYQKTNEKIHQVGDKISQSDVYQKTNAALKTAGEKTSAAFSTFGTYTSKKLSDARNSSIFKSMEEKVGGAYSSVKTKVSGSKSENDFEEALNSSKSDGQDVPLGDPSTPPKNPEDKVPL